jgi:F-type H+-transporting ATPase subunit delta
MSAVGRRYAKALYDLAKAESAVDRVQKDLTGIADAWDASAELRNVFENPAFAPEVKKKVLVAIAERNGATRLVVNAVSLLADRRRLRYVRDIADAFVAIVERASGRVRAEVITASPLPDGYYAQLSKVLSEATGREVTITKRVDPSIIGGVVTRVGDTVYDGSIKNRLSDLKSDLLARTPVEGAASGTAR